MGIYQKLLNIQFSLKCKKGQYNSFGKYYYRSCEDILEAAKPICNAVGCVLTISDNIELIGDRFYVKATAKLTDIETGEYLDNTAFAREEADKKGMDGSQITGTASSYARKYCLNGLFCIDDTKDADTNEYHTVTDRKPKAPAKTEPEQCKRDVLLDLVQRKKANLTNMLRYFNVENIEELNEEQLDRCIRQLKGKSNV